MILEVFPSLNDSVFHRGGGMAALTPGLGDTTCSEP